jgi:hypothetical protein
MHPSEKEARSLLKLQVAGAAAALALATWVAYSAALRAVVFCATIYFLVYIFYERLIARLLMWKLKHALDWDVLISAVSLRVDFSHGLRRPRISFCMENARLLNPNPEDYAGKCFVRCQEFSFELLLDKFPRKGDALRFLRVSWVGMSMYFARSSNKLQGKRLNFVELDTIRVKRKLKRKGYDLDKLKLNCLRVKVIAARQLRSGATTIDPRVVVRYQIAEEHTATKVATCNPVWVDEAAGGARAAAAAAAAAFSSMPRIR